MERRRCGPLKPVPDAQPRRRAAAEAPIVYTVAEVADRLKISPGTPLKRTATSHMLAMLAATGTFLVTAIVGYSDGMDGVVGSGGLILSLVAFALLTLGGWLGGAIVFVHGMRVLGLEEEPTHRAVSPVPHPEKERTES